MSPTKSFFQELVSNATNAAWTVFAALVLIIVSAPQGKDDEGG
jgi:hypothetical protein